MTSIKTEATNGLLINEVNISNTIQINLTKFAVTVVGLPLTYFIFKHFNSRRVFNFYSIMLQTFDAKYLNEYKPDFVVLTLFLKEYVCDLKL